MGDRLYGTDYSVKLLHDDYCKVLCRFNYENYQENFLYYLINNQYNATYYLDGLPASFINFESNRVEYQGIPLGKRISNEKYIFYNHLTFHIELQVEDEFSFEKALKSLRTAGKQFLTNAGMMSSNNSTGEISENSSKATNEKNPFKDLKFTVRKFQITPFSIQHSLYDDGELLTNCFKKEYIIDDIITNARMNQSNNFNYSNYDLLYSGTSDLNITTYEEYFYPIINSKKNIEYFKDSLSHNYLSNQNIVNSTLPTYLTYDIKFTISKKDSKMVSRWDHYLKLSSSNDNIHWWSLINSSIAIAVTTIVVSSIFCRVIRKDIDYIQLVKL